MNKQIDSSGERSEPTGNGDRGSRLKERALSIERKAYQEHGAKKRRNGMGVIPESCSTVGLVTQLVSPLARHDPGFDL